MSKYSYSASVEGEHAKAVGRDLPISAKHSVEICRHLRGMNLGAAKKFLQQVIELKAAVPYRRFFHDLAHKRNIGAGRYPVRPAEEILVLLESAEANAQNKGMNTATLGIVHMCAQRASRPYKAGRHRGRLHKRAHIEIIVAPGQIKESAAKKGVAASSAKSKPSGASKADSAKTQKSSKSDATMKKESSSAKLTGSAQSAPQQASTTKGGHQ